MSDRRPATNIGELDIHLGHAMGEISKVGERLATIEGMLAKLATRDYVDDQVRLVNEKINAAKPSTQLVSFSKIAAAIMVLVAFVGMMFEVVVTLQHVRQSLPSAPTIGAKP